MVDSNVKPDPNVDSLAISLSTVQKEPIDWVWRHRMAIGYLTLIAGNPGVGKGLLTVDTATRVTTERPWPDSMEPAKKGRVIFCTAEDDPSETLLPRLEWAGANVDLVSVYKKHDLDALDFVIKNTPNCRLVFVDPLSAFAGSGNLNQAGTVRSVLRKLAGTAKKRGVAIVVVAHLNKGNGPAIQRISGSMALTEVPRFVLAVEKAKFDENLRLVAPVKSNMGSDKSAVAFRIAVTKETACLEWAAKMVQMNGDDALYSETTDQKNARNEAQDFLNNVLKLGPLDAVTIRSKGAKEGHSWATIRRAKKELGVITYREGFGADGKWIWELPEVEL